jgi:hypothetical protein
MLRTNRFRCLDSQREPEPRIVLQSLQGARQIVVDAASLCDQFAVSRSETLLILDEDNPYEERLHLVLVRGDDVLDHVVIGAPYAGGIFRIVDSHSDRLRFRFEGETIWSLSVDPEGRRSLAGLPRGARRRGGLLTRAHISLNYDVDS